MILSEDQSVDQSDGHLHFTQAETTERVSVRLSGYAEGCVAYVQHFTEKYKPGFNLSS